MTRALYIDDQRVDLPEDVRFQLTFQIADFGELRPRGSGSNTIKLPKTPRNTAIFDNCNFVQVNSNFPYVVHSAYYYEDGWLVFSDATVYMLAITETDFEIQCVWGNSNTIRELKALDMGDVEGLGNVNYGADAYAAIETGEDEVDGKLETATLAVTENGLVSKYTRGLLSVEKALNAVGFENDNISQSVLNYLNGLHVFPAIQKTSIKSLQNYRGTYSLNQQTDPNWNNSMYRWCLSCAPSFPTSPIVVEFGEDSKNNREVYIPYIAKGIYYDLEVSLEVFKVVPGGSSQTEKDSASVGIDIYAYNEKFKLRDYEGTVQNKILNYTDVYREAWDKKKGQTLNIKKTIRFKMPDNFTEGIILIVAGELLMNFQSYVEFSIDVTITARGTDYLDIDIPMPVKSVNENGLTVGFSDVFRGKNAYDFISQSIINAGAIFDNKEGKTRVFTYNDIANNTAEMLDWTEKVVYITEENVFNQDIGAKNYIRYKSSDKYNGFGDGYFSNEIAENFKKENKDIVTNTLFSFVNGVDIRPFGYVNPVYGIIPMFLKKDDELSFIGDNGFWLVKLGNTFNFPLINDDIQAVEGARYVHSVERIQPIFDNIRDSNWKTLIDINEKYRKVKAVLRLSARDVSDLDFKRPIYLRQYAQSYIVTKVDYKPNASVVEMLLIR